MKQRTFFALSFIAGLLWGMAPINDWIHESGHKFAFEQSGKSAAIISHNRTVVASSTIEPHEYMAGAVAEFQFYYFFVWVFFLLSNPNRTNWRYNWWYIGFPLGTCHFFLFYALKYTDFQHVDVSTWFTVNIFLLGLFWIMVFGFRWRFR